MFPGDYKRQENYATAMRFCVARITCNVYKNKGRFSPELHFRCNFYPPVSAPVSDGLSARLRQRGYGAMQAAA